MWIAILRFRAGGLPRGGGGGVFKAPRLVYHSTLGWRVITKKKGGRLSAKRCIRAHEACHRIERGGESHQRKWTRVLHPSFRALSGRLKLTVRRHKFNNDSLLLGNPQLQAVHQIAQNSSQVGHFWRKSINFSVKMTCAEGKYIDRGETFIDNDTAQMFSFH